ncbi:hypothetical protein CRUP_007681, partial [Coryphaenoides rupestris]
PYQFSCDVKDEVDPERRRRRRANSTVMWMSEISSFPQSKANGYIGLALRDTNCTIRNFQDGNLFDIHFDIISLEETYHNGRLIIIPCKNGYQGFFQITCTQGQWHKVFGGVCEPKPCGHPGESLHADFSLEFGSDFVFASVVEYKCHRGHPDIETQRHRLQRSRHPDIQTPRDPETQSSRAPELQTSRASRHPDIQRPSRDPDIQSSRHPELQRPRHPDIQTSRHPDTQRPRDPETQRPRAPETKTPRHSRHPDIQTSRHPETQRPRDPETQSSRAPELQSSRDPDIQTSRDI